MNVKKYIGSRIAKARRQNHKTQTELADILGINFVTVSRWETGARFPGVTKLDQLALVLDVPIAYFFYGWNSNINT